MDGAMIGARVAGKLVELKSFCEKIRSAVLGVFPRWKSAGLTDYDDCLAMRFSPEELNSQPVNPILGMAARAPWQLDANPSTIVPLDGFSLYPPCDQNLLASAQSAIRQPAHVFDSGKHARLHPPRPTSYW